MGFPGGDCNDFFRHIAGFKVRCCCCGVGGEASSVRPSNSKAVRIGGARVRQRQSTLPVIFHEMCNKINVKY